MNLDRYVTDLQSQLRTAAEAGGEEVVASAERLSAALGSATRLVLFEALAAAASEITLDLAPGSVEVRLRGRDPEFVLTGLPTGQSYEAVAEEITDPPPSASEEGEGGMARTTLRLPDHLKQRLDDAANRNGLSVNAWLIRAVTEALKAEQPGRRGRRRDPGDQSYTGWAR
ncbi:MAG: histidine kinase [Ornithinimicrobium sp.]